MDQVRAHRAVSARLTELIASADSFPAGSSVAGALHEGSSVARFQILREVGYGGFGVVYEALDPELGRKVAIKVLRVPDRRLDDAERQRLREEAEAVAGLEHPGIVTLYDAGTCDAGPYLVFELLRGEALDVRLRRGSLKPREALRVATEVAKALAHAHEHGVLHRDLKPANVFLTEDGRVKLLDFGLAHLLGGENARRGGTPAYMAPEQARGEQIDARADVFAFGVMCYELISGRLPFAMRKGRSSVLDGESPAPLREKTPKIVASFIERCLSAERALRPNSGRAVLDELLVFERTLKRDTSPVLRAPEASASLAKIARPRLPPVFQRKRLFRRLDRALSRPVIWVEGPPGAGKTTLVGSYVEARKLPTLWYQVDEGDAELGTFFHYFSAAASKAELSKGPLPPFSPDHLRNLPRFARLWFRRLYAQSVSPFVFVFDNFQTVPTDSAFQVAIRVALEELPEGAHAILVSRNDPVPALARLRATNAMVIVPSDELRLSPAESEGIARIRASGRCSRAEIKLIHDRIQGWAAGLVLLLERRRMEALAATGAERPEAIFGYFAGEILERADGPTRQVLLETALLPRFTGAMAHQLTGVEQADAILADLSNRGYFTTRSGENEAHYQFHPLFREFLLARGVRALSPDRLVRLRIKAARVLRDAGDAEEAVALYRQTEQWDELVELVLQQARALLGKGRAETLERWISSIPADRRDRTPWLYYWLGAARLSFNIARAHADYERLFELQLAAGDVAGAYLCCASRTAYSLVDIWTDAADVPNMDVWIDRFEQLWARFPSGQTADVTARATGSFLPAIMRRRPTHPQYRLWHKRAIDIAYGVGLEGAEGTVWAGGGYINDVTGLRLAMGAALGYELILRGELAEGADLVRALGPLARLGTASPFVGIWWLETEAMQRSLVAGDPEAALRSVREARAICEKVALHRMELLIDFQEVFALMVLGALDRARALLDSIQTRLTAVTNQDKPIFEFVSGLLALRMRASARSLDHARAIISIGDRTGMVGFVIFGHLLAARALEDCGNVDSIRSHLHVARAISTEAKMAIGDYVASLIETRLDLAAGDRASAIESLRRAFSLGPHGGLVHHLWFTRSETDELCALALENAIHCDYARGLVSCESTTAARSVLPSEVSAMS